MRLSPEILNLTLAGLLPILYLAVLTSACSSPPSHLDAMPILTTDTSEDAVRRLVVVTFNTHSFQEGPDSAEKLATLGRGLATLEADLVGLNEVISGALYAYDFGGVEVDAAAIVRQSIEAATGQPWFLARQGFGHWDQGEEMSNALLSRYPIAATDARALTTTDFWPAPDGARSVLFARLSLPDARAANVFVTHTWGWDSADTLTQVAEVKAFMAEKAQGDEVAELLLGDLNTSPTSEAYAAWLLPPPLTLTDAFAVAHPERQLETSTLDGQDRIDYILVRDPGEDRVPRVVDAFFAFTGEPSEPSGLPVVSDHKAVVVELELSSAAP